MYCPHCGAEARETDIFCSQCGGRLGVLQTGLAAPPSAGEEAGPLPPPAAPEPAEAPLSPDIALMPRTPADEALVCTPAPPRQGAGNWKWLLLALGALAFICFCCFLSFILLAFSGGSA